MAKTAWDPRHPRIERQSGSCVPRILYDIYEADSETFVAGDLVKLDSSGDVVAATAGDAQIAGIAMKSATNVTSGNIEIPVQFFTTETDILIQVSASGTLEAANTACEPGECYDIILDSNSEFWTLDSDDTTNPVFIYLEPIKDVNGDATYWARVRPILGELDFSTIGV